MFKVFRAISVSRQKRQVNINFLSRRQLNLGLFGLVAQTLHGGFVVGDVQAVFFLELVHKVIDQHAVEIGAAQVRITVGGLYFEHAVAQLQDGNVKGTAT